MVQDKLIDKLRKMQAARDGEAKLGNSAAAEAFAAAINRLMLQHELSEQDLRTGGTAAGTREADAIVKLYADLAKYGIKRVGTRVDWQERLASIVAQAHLCRILVIPGSNRVVFAGTQSHAEVAEFTWGTLVPLVDKLSVQARVTHFNALRKANASREELESQGGYRAAWINAFVVRIAERFREERRMAEQETGNAGTAMIRLNNALSRVDQFIAAGTRGSASSLNARRSGNAAGARDGRAAADRVKLGRDRIAQGTSGLLK